MASPQVENGALQVADDLQLAIMRFGFTGLERQVLDAIMRYTYLAGKTRAEINPEDIRLIAEGRVRLRTDRIEQVLNKLTAQNVLTYQSWNNRSLRGIQKNYEAWVDKMSSTLKGIDINNINNNSRRVVDKMSTSAPISTPEALIAYSQKQSGITHSVNVWRVERSWANKLYRKLLAKTNDPFQAKYLIMDYIDENEWMRQNVQRQFAYMYTRFDQWMAQIPRKPREIRENELALGRRYRYNVKLKTWSPVTIAGQKEV